MSNEPLGDGRRERPSTLSLAESKKRLKLAKNKRAGHKRCQKSEAVFPLYGQYLRAGLIDSLQFALFPPFVLGRGEALFADLDLPCTWIFSDRAHSYGKHATHFVLERA